MSSAPVSRAGRPKASSRETIAEAASELFLERGYAHTSTADIATRAGVSRSSFFNYFASKADVLWGGFDERLDAAVEALAADVAGVEEVLAAMAAGFAPDSLALAIANADAMGVSDELERDRALRHARLARAVAEHEVRSGIPRMVADVRGSTAAGALLAAVWAWADAGPGRTELGAVVQEALAVARHPSCCEAPGDRR